MSPFSEERHEGRCRVHLTPFILLEILIVQAMERSLDLCYEGLKSQVVRAGIFQSEN